MNGLADRWRSHRLLDDWREISAESQMGTELFVEERVNNAMFLAPEPTLLNILPLQARGIAYAQGVTGILHSKTIV